MTNDVIAKTPIRQCIAGLRSVVGCVQRAVQVSTRRDPLMVTKNINMIAAVGPNSVHSRIVFQNQYVSTRLPASLGIAKARCSYSSPSTPPLLLLTFSTPYTHPVHISRPRHSTYLTITTSSSKSRNVLLERNRPFQLRWHRGTSKVFMQTRCR